MNTLALLYDEGKWRRNRSEMKSLWLVFNKKQKQKCRTLHRGY
jgi:hypothetical protein